jgi:uncharacterized membrane protein YczE
MTGLVLFGVGISMVVLGGNGVPSWDVFHQGVAVRTPLSMGVVVILTGAVLLLAMAVLREPIGLGTVLNVIVIGLVIDLLLAVVGSPGHAAARAAYTLAGPFVIAAASGLYLGVRLGPGPRDGLMTAMARRGITIWKARLTVEVAVVVAGYLMGGTVGWGTIWFALSIGPAVQVALRLLSVPWHPEEPRVSALKGVDD